jgi:hypothetical protein
MQLVLLCCQSIKISRKLLYKFVRLWAGSLREEYTFRPNDCGIEPLSLLSGTAMLLVANQPSYGESTMLTKIALAAALAIGTAGAALASNENDGDTGGYRQLGPGGVVTDGVNPVFHRSLRVGASSAYGYAPGYASKRRDHVKK